MKARNGNRYVRLGVASFAVAVAITAIGPAATALAASTHKPSSQSQSAKQKKAAPAPAKKKTTPGNSAQSNSAPQRSASAPAAAPAPKPKSKPQRKDKPPDRSPHKATPKKSTPAGQSSVDRAKSNDKKKSDTRDKQRRAERQTTPAPSAGTGSAPSPSGILGGVNSALKELAGRPKQPLPTSRTIPLPADRQLRCDVSGCLVIHPTPKPQKPKAKPGIRTLDNPDVVDQAEEELENWQGPDPDGSNKYGRWYDQVEPIVEWCARFVSWVYAQAGFPLPDMQIDQWDRGDTGFQYVPAGEAYAKEHGLWHDGTTGVEPGDIVTFNWGAGTPGDTESDHTGIVTKVNPDGSIETIEGNSGNQVVRRTYPANDPQVTGYIRPPAAANPPTNDNLLPGHLRSRPGTLPFRE